MAAVLAENLNNNILLELATVKAFAKNMSEPLSTIKYRCKKSKYPCQKVSMNGGQGYIININKLHEDIKGMYLKNLQTLDIRSMQRCLKQLNTISKQLDKAANEKILSNFFTINSTIKSNNFLDNNYEIKSLRSSDNNEGCLFNHDIKICDPVFNNTELESISNNQEFPLTNMFPDDRQESLEKSLDLPIVSSCNEFVESENNDLVPTTTEKSFYKLPVNARNEARAREAVIKEWQARRKKEKKAGIKHTVTDDVFLAEYKIGTISTLRKELELLGPIARSTLYNWSKIYKDSGNDWTSLVCEYGYKTDNTIITMLTEEEKSLVLKELLTQNKLPIETGIKYAKIAVENLGRPSKSSNKTWRRFVENWKRQNNADWHYQRGTLKSVKEKLHPSMLKDKSDVKVGQCILTDGHVLNIQVMDELTGKPFRPILVCYMDLCSRYILGYEITKTENTYCIASAFKKSVLTLGKYPENIYEDNGKAFTANYFEAIEGIFQKLHINLIHALPYNATGKAEIERFFGTVDMQFARKFPSYVGNDIRNKPAYMHRNEKAHKKQHEEETQGQYPTIEDVKKCLNYYLSFYHHKEKHPEIKDKTKAEIFEAGKGTGINEIDIDEIMMLQKTMKLGPEGIHLNGGYYLSDTLIDHPKEKVLVRYNQFDLSYVLVYTLDGRLIDKALKRKLYKALVNECGTAEDKEHFENGIKDQKRREKALINNLKTTSTLNKSLQLGTESNKKPQLTLINTESVAEIDNVIDIEPKVYTRADFNYEYEWNDYLENGAKS